MRARRAVCLAFPHFLRQAAAAPPVARLRQLIRQVIDVYARPRAARRSRHHRRRWRRWRCSVNCCSALSLAARSSSQQARAKQRYQRARHASQSAGASCAQPEAHDFRARLQLQAAPRPLPRHVTAPSCVRAIRDALGRDASKNAICQTVVACCQSGAAARGPRARPLAPHSGTRRSTRLRVSRLCGVRRGCAPCLLPHAPRAPPPLHSRLALRRRFPLALAAAHVGLLAVGYEIGARGYSQSYSRQDATAP